MSDRITDSVTMAIPNFSKLTSIYLNSFKLNNGFEIFFGINPKTIVHMDEHVSVFVMNRSTDIFEFQYKVSILNVKGEKLVTKEYTGEFNILNSVTLNYGSFMSRSEMLHWSKGYLYHDLLTLYCELEVIDRKAETVDSISLHNDLNSLSEEFQSLLNDDKYVDFTLVVGEDGKEFHVHKAILSARSPVFAAMFEHDCEEKRQNKVNITDMDEEVCAEMMSYIYTGKVKELDRFAMELLVAADKYQMDSLKTLCEQYLSSNLSIETASNVLILADLHRASGLKTKCIDFISNNSDKVKDTEGWKVLNTSANYKLLGELFFIQVHVRNESHSRLHL